MRILPGLFTDRIVSPAGGASAIRSPANSLTSGLLFYYDLDEASGLRLETMTQGLGPARLFTRANNEVLTHADDALLQTGNIDFTYTGWFYLESTGVEHGLVSKWLTTGNQRGHRFQVNSSNILQLVVSSDGTSAAAVTFTTTYTVTSGVWYWFAFGHDSVNNVLFVRLNMETTQTTAHTAGVHPSTATFEVGRAGNSAGSALNGRMQNVKFWKKVLTEAQMWEEWNNGRGLLFRNMSTDGKTDLIAAWQMNELSGNAADYHTNALHLTDTNTVTQALGLNDNLSLNDVNTVTETSGFATFTAANSEMLQSPDATPFDSSDTDWSFTVDVYLETTAADHTIFSKDTGAGGGREYRLRYDNSDDRLHWEVFDGTNSIGSVLADTLGAPADDTVYRVVVTHSSASNTVTIAVDGGTADSANTTGAASSGTAAPFRVGASASGTPEYLNGRVRRIARWSRLLTAGELTALAAGGVYPTF